MEPNVKVYRVHRLLAFLYGGVGAILCVAIALGAGRHSVSATLGSMTAVATFFGVICAMHYFTARACLRRKSGGQTASRAIAIFMLFGFPIGTAIGVYLLMNSGGWRKPGEDAPREAALDF